ncbi:MAG: hypothetical protein ACHQX3_06920 [Nitrospirales bacterium]|jgi:hypothetical protein
MAKLKRIEAGAGEVMAAAGFDPVVRAMALLDEEREMDEEMMKAGRYMDWEPSGGGKMQVRASIRLKGLLELAAFAHSKRKASDVEPGSKGVVVVIENRAESSPGGQGRGQRGVEVEIE